MNYKRSVKKVGANKNQKKEGKNNHYNFFFGSSTSE